TVTEHRTTAVTTKKEGTTTVPSATITIFGPTVAATGSGSASINISKRAPVPTAAVQFYKALPFARNIRDGVAPEALVSSVSSGCACLYLETQTVQIFSTPKTTRTLTANARQTIIEYSNTLLSGVTTEIAVGTPSIPSTFISVPSIPSSSRVVSSPFTNLTLPTSTISISTTSLSLNSSIPLPTPTLPSSGFSISATRSFNLSTPISSIPIPSTPGVSVPSLRILTLSTISTPISSVPSVSVPSLSFPTLLNISTSVTGSPTFPTLANLTSLSIILSTGSVRTPSVFNLTSISPTTPTTPLSSVNITKIIGSTGLSISIPSTTKPVDPFNTTRIIGPTIPLSSLSFTISDSFNTTRVIGSTGLPLPTPSFSAGVSLNISVNASVTRGPTA
ncbi:hypothetical protein MMC29_001455, partial [Sticta canariensis]|nr:hypothetical protein [Sticta canariensis]